MGDDISKTERCRCQFSVSIGLNYTESRKKRTNDNFYIRREKTNWTYISYRLHARKGTGKSWRPQKKVFDQIDAIDNLTLNRILEFHHQQDEEGIEK